MLNAVIHCAFGQVVVTSDPCHAPTPFSLRVARMLGEDQADARLYLSDDQVRYLRALCDAHLSTRGGR